MKQAKAKLLIEIEFSFDPRLMDAHEAAQAAFENMDCTQETVLDVTDVEITHEYDSREDDCDEIEDRFFGAT